MKANDRLLPADREYAAWLGDVEHRVVLPLKWALMALVVLYWMWLRGWTPPSPAAFGVFYVYAALTAAEHYFFARDRITPRQVRSFVLASFLLDLVFVCALVWLDMLESGGARHGTGVSEFFPLFIFAVLRGFALYRTRTENMAGFLAVSVPFLGLAWLQVGVVDILDAPPVLRSLALTWGVMLLMQVFIGLVAKQKAELLRLRESEVRSQSLSSLGELTAGVAHEINNPIGIIKTYADYLEKSTAPEDPLREDFDTIRKEAERCQEIVRRMLDFSNPDVRGFTALSLAGIVRETVGFVFMEHREGGPVIRVSEAGSVPDVRGDAVQLKQALINILINARQILEEHAASPEAPEGHCGEVTVTIGRGTGPRPPVRVTIRDNGPGMDPGEAEKLFEPFYTRRRKGTGLGLAITRRIVEAHKGSIRIAPHPEGGTAVTLEIPIAGEEEA